MRYSNIAMARKNNSKDSFNKHTHSWAATYKIGKVITSNFNIHEVLSLIAKIACIVTKSHAAKVVTIDNATTGEFVQDKNFKTLSKLCEPVIFNRRILANLTLYSDKKGHYTKEHKKITSALACQVALAIQNYHLYNNMHVNYFNTIRSLVLAMEAKDPYTKGHSERVTEYALVIASTMDLPAQQVQMIKYCGLLHDLGKIAVSDTILNKPYDLTEDERIQIERHPAEGAAVLSPLSFLRPGISIVRHHHEKFDGTGYPDRLKADKIPLAARILTCADAFDAMTSDRPYRLKMTKEKAFDELKSNAGSQFDPEVVDVFLKSMTAD